MKMMKRSLYFGGTAVAVIVALLFGYVMGTYSALPLETSIPAHELEQYTLFTWNTRSGDLCFAMMREFQRPKFIHSWFPKRNAKCGISELKKALTALPKDTYVLWEDWPPQGFDYPPDNVVKEVVEFAQKNGIHLKESPALQ